MARRARGLGWIREPPAMPGMALDYLIIANPTSGHRKAPSLAADVNEILKNKGHSSDLALTEGPGDATTKARKAAEDGVKVVVACGGDGTLQEISGALIGSSSLLGILPRGRCNDLAKALGITKADSAGDLADILCGEHTTRLDLGQLKPMGKPPGGDAAVAGNGRCFCTVATLGLDSRVSRFVEQRKLPIKGTAAYVYAMLRVLMGFKPISVRIKGDFGSFEGRLVLAATGNTAFYGGAMQIAPGAVPTDGVFDLCLVTEIPKLSILRIMPKLFRGTHVSHPAVHMMRSTYIDVETPGGPEWICADGESIGQTPARIEVKAGVLEVKTKRPIG